jgi:hypothetical protein
MKRHVEQFQTYRETKLHKLIIKKLATFKCNQRIEIAGSVWQERYQSASLLHCSKETPVGRHINRRCTDGIELEREFSIKK